MLHITISNREYTTATGFGNLAEKRPRETVSATPSTPRRGLPSRKNAHTIFLATQVALKYYRKNFAGCLGIFRRLRSKCSDAAEVGRHKATIRTRHAVWPHCPLPSSPALTPDATKEQLCCVPTTLEFAIRPRLFKVLRLERLPRRKANRSACQKFRFDPNWPLT